MLVFHVFKKKKKPVTPVETIRIWISLLANTKSHRIDALDSILIIKRLYFLWSIDERARTTEKKRSTFKTNRNVSKLVVQYRAHIPHSKGDYVVFVIYSTCFFFQLLSKECKQFMLYIVRSLILFDWAKQISMSDVIYSLVWFEFLQNQVWMCRGCMYIFQKNSSTFPFHPYLIRLPSVIFQ